MEGELRGLFEQAAGFTIGAVLVCSSRTPAIVAGVLLLGVVYARNLEFVHQCLHNTAFKRRAMNRAVGTLLALPMLVHFEQWRHDHIRHHRDVRREGFRYELDRLTTKRELLLHLFMVRHYCSDGRLAWAVAAAAVCSLTFHTPLPWLLWIAPLPIAALVHTHIELPEHLGCERSSRDALRNSRVIRASRVATWFVHYNNYHAVHHWRAGVPNRRLPEVHAATPQLFAELTYPAFYAQFYASFFRAR